MLNMNVDVSAFLQRYQLRNVFNIPEDLVLPEDSVQMTHPLTPDENQQREKDMEELRKHILAVRFFHL